MIIFVNLFITENSKATMIERVMVEGRVLEGKPVSNPSEEINAK
jgi:hypothetical protein